MSARRTGIAGFTLVEALLATALMGVILAAIGTVTAQWLPNWNRGFTRVQSSETLAAGLERIVADLAAAEFVTAGSGIRQPVFDGTELSVTFLRTALGPNTRPGLELVRIMETGGEMLGAAKASCRRRSAYRFAMRAPIAGFRSPPRRSCTPTCRPSACSPK